MMPLDHLHVTNGDLRRVTDNDLTHIVLRCHISRHFVIQDSYARGRCGDQAPGDAALLDDFPGDRRPSGVGVSVHACACC